MKQLQKETSMSEHSSILIANIVTLVFGHGLNGKGKASNRFEKKNNRKDRAVGIFHVETSNMKLENIPH